MPSIPDDMSAAATARRAQLAEEMRTEEAKKASALPKIETKPRIAKGR